MSLNALDQPMITGISMGQLLRHFSLKNKSKYDITALYASLRHSASEILNVGRLLFENLPGTIYACALSEILIKMHFSLN